MLLVGLAAGGAWFVIRQPFAARQAFIPPTTGPEAAEGFTVLSANVGNADPFCLPYVVKLCRRDVEARLAANIRVLRPDVVALQEVLPDWLCEKYPLAAPGSVCAGAHTEPQVRRLLGPEYTIVCESRNAFECLAVRVEAGEIEGCPPGGLCETDRIDVHAPGCRWNVSIMAATVRIRGRTFDLVNAHPESRSAACRLASLRQIFEPGGLVRERDVLLLGDFNMDPWREDDVSTRYWNEQVGAPGEAAYIYHSGIAEHQPPYPTLRYGRFRRTYDHVLSNFLTGTVQVLGESPGTTRLDGGQGMDHRAVYGRLSFGKP